MGKELFEKYGIRQLGYSVESIEETAQLYHDLFGAGPFIDMGVNAPRELQDSWRRGASQDAHGNRVPRRHGDRAHRGQERLSEPVI